MPKNTYYTGNKVWVVVVSMPKLAGRVLKVVCPAHTRLAADQAVATLTKNHDDKDLKFALINPW